MKHIASRLFTLALAAALLFSAVGCESPVVSFQAPALSHISGEITGRISAAVVYAPGTGSGTWEDTLSYLDQSIMVGLDGAAVAADADTDYSPYHLLYLDASLAQLEKEDLAPILSFVQEGGTVVVDNALCSLFDPTFLGAKSFVKVDRCPVDVDAPDLGPDLGEIQEIILDFAGLYPSYVDYEGDLAGRDYGYAMVCGTATPLIGWEDLGLYTVNTVGDGMVFFMNPMLPNFFNAAGFDMDAEEGQLNFANTTSGCNQLLVSALAQYVSKQLYGFSMSRVFGSNGAPSMAWELHYEEITGIENGSMQIFDQLCREYGQIPSYTLIRNSYTWFLRSESVTYYLNEGTAAQPEFYLDFYENAYASGTHIAAGDRWLTLADVENAGSYFVDYPQYTQRAYPELCDYNGDRKADLFCGSSDGQVHFFAGEGFSDRMHTAEAVALTDEKGQPLQTEGGNSAPALADLNGDGHLDLLVGDNRGRIHWYRGDGSLTFTAMGLLLDSSVPGQVFPATGDVNGDGITDLALGSNSGCLLVYYGTEQNGAVTFSQRDMDSLSLLTANEDLGSWLAPEICDYDGDGKAELLVGTKDGYVAIIQLDGKAFSPAGFITTDELNYKGNDRIKTGSNCVPVLWDINGDGAADLVCGSLEYGMAYSIDSPYFPYARQVQEQLDYAEENFLYVGPHFYTNAYASQNREAYELQAHLQALKTYGLDAEGLGTNQHTWYTSTFSQSQSMDSIYDAGLAWQSGFGPAGGSYRAPQSVVENAVTMPFFLTREGEKTLLVQNCSVLTYMDEAISAITGRYGAPTCMYFHCDFVYADDTDDRAAMETLSNYWWTYGYNFVREDQLMKAVSAAYGLDVAVSGDVEGGLTLTPLAGNELPLQDARYRKAAGVKLSFRQNVDVSGLTCDAAVLRREGNDLYLSLDRAASIRPGTPEDSPLERVNLPADITFADNKAHVDFLDSGMMQLVVDGDASTSDAGWTVTQREGRTIFTKYGDAQSVTIQFQN